MLRNSVEDQHSQVTWQNFATTTESILDIFKNSNIALDDLRIADPSRIQTTDSVIVSLFMYNIAQNSAIKDHAISAFSEPQKEYRFSENILEFLLTVHSDEHMLAMNAIEKLLGVIYSNPTVSVSNEIEKAHMRVNLKENPIEVWDKLFPATPYRLSILLKVHGPGVTYQKPTTEHKNVLYYDSTEEPEELF